MVLEAQLYNQFSGDREGRFNRSRGFKMDFTDEVGPGNSPNQVRHTAAGIFAGYAGGVAAIPGGAATYGLALSITLDQVDERERSYQSTLVPGTLAGIRVYQRVLLPPTASQAADMRLNGISVPIGFALGVGAISSDHVGELIRLSTCN